MPENLVILSFRKKAKYPHSAFAGLVGFKFSLLWIFRFVLTHSAQNDKFLTTMTPYLVILSFRKKAKYP